MDHSEFRIGQACWCSNRLWRCTDVGQRAVVAIRIDNVTAVTVQLATQTKTERTMTGADAARDGWFNGPPYAVAESVFDENDLEGCTLTQEEQ